MRPLLIIAIIILGLFLFKYFYLDADKNKSEKESSSAQSSQRTSSALSVDIYVAKEVKQSDVVYASGTVVPNEEVEIKSEASGRLIKLNINESGKRNSCRPISCG